LKKLITAVAFVAWSITANATELIVDQRPFYARTLSGVVTDATGYPLPGATIQQVRCEDSPQNPAVLRQVIADGRGLFSFGRFTTAKACLRFSMNGFNIVQIKVYRREDAGDLAQKLTPAT
jgi:hypothetical protein